MSTYDDGRATDGVDGSEVNVVDGDGESLDFDTDVDDFDFRGIRSRSS